MECCQSVVRHSWNQRVLWGPHVDHGTWVGFRFRSEEDGVVAIVRILDDEGNMANALKECVGVSMP
jgi:hypothetical protein